VHLDEHPCHTVPAERIPSQTGHGIPDLDPRAVCDHLGVPIPPVCTTSLATKALADAMLTGKVDPADVTRLHHEVWANVNEIDWEIASGTLKRTPRLVQGRPLADLLDLDTLARLLREGFR
jgi:hypothetical protein